MTRTSAGPDSWGPGAYEIASWILLILMFALMLGMLYALGQSGEEDFKGLTVATLGSVPQASELALIAEALPYR